MSFPRYPVYKDSGVEWLGEVPGEWKVVPLKAVSTHNDDVLEESTAPDTEIAYVDISSVDGVNGIKTTETMLFAAAPSRARRRVKHGDVIVSTVRTYLKAIARIREPEENLIVSTGFAVIRPRGDLVHDFLGHLVSAGFFVEQVIARSTGVSYPAINASELVAIPVPVPPLPEQTQIAAFLDRETAKIDALVAEQRSLTDLLKEKRQAVISHAVTRGLNPDVTMKASGNLWLGDVPAHWEVKRLKHVKGSDKNAFVDGPFGSNLKSEHFIDDGDVYVIESSFATQGRLEADNLKTISVEHFNTISRSETRGGDIIIAKIGAQYGKASILPNLDKPAVVSGNSLKLTINERSCDVRFVNWQLANLKKLGVMEDIVNATAQPALSLGEMNNLPMLVPPRPEQEAIVRFLDDRLGQLDTLTAEAKHAIDLLQERRTALISAAVTGQIDVRELAAPNLLETT